MQASVSFRFTSRKFQYQIIPTLSTVHEFKNQRRRTKVFYAGPRNKKNTYNTINYKKIRLETGNSVYLVFTSQIT